MKEQVLDRLARLLKYFKGLEHENNEKEYAYILKGTINGITYSIKNLEDFFEKKFTIVLLLLLLFLKLPQIFVR